MSECIRVEQWLEGDPQAQRHAETCPDCGALADDLRQIRERVRGLDPQGWAGEPAPEVDPEAALRAVWGEIDRIPAARRPSRWVLQAASTLAAAVLLFSFAAPSLLRWRIESSPTGASLSSVGGDQGSAIFWTTASR